MEEEKITLTGGKRQRGEICNPNEYHPAFEKRKELAISIKTTGWLLEHKDDIEVFYWPPYVPDYDLPEPPN